MYVSVWKLNTYTKLLQLKLNRYMRYCTCIFVDYYVIKRFTEYQLCTFFS